MLPEQCQRQTRYTQIGKEALATTWGSEKFSTYIYSGKAHQY